MLLHQNGDESAVVSRENTAARIAMKIAEILFDGELCGLDDLPVGGRKRTAGDSHRSGQ